MILGSAVRNATCRHVERHIYIDLHMSDNEKMSKMPPSCLKSGPLVKHRSGKRPSTNSLDLCASQRRGWNVFSGNYMSDKTYLFQKKGVYSSEGVMLVKALHLADGQQACNPNRHLMFSIRSRIGALDLRFHSPPLKRVPFEAIKFEVLSAKYLYFGGLRNRLQNLGNGTDIGSRYVANTLE